MSKYKIGSLFDGSGGFPLAASMYGIVPTWASEVEPYPIAVTRSRFPQMLHLGDISKINGAEIEPVDVITFGSPCQDLSVAGKRAGLKHEASGDEETTRSGLFMEAIRIIKEMRNATNGKYPTFILWENVPGAFSSNRGGDFQTVLEEIIKIKENSGIMLETHQGGWPYAGVISGDGFQIAYRTFDAQYWGVPQRRRRIHLVADFRGERAGEILFKREGLRGYFTEGRAPWKRTSGDTKNCATADDRARECIALENHPADSRVTISSDGMCQTLTSRMGTGGGNVPMVMDQEPVYCIEGNGSRQSHNGNGYIEGETMYTPNTIERHAVCYAVDRAAFNQGINAQYDISIQEELSQTLVAKGPNAVCCANWDGSQVAPTLTANNAGGSQRMPDKDNFNCVIEVKKPRYIVRRLTPTECARLQGFPDIWGRPDCKADLTDEEYKFWQEVRNTHATINDKAVKDYTKAQMLAWYNKLHTDSAEYKMWGNGIALPVAMYVFEGMAEAFKKEQ